MRGDLVTLRSVLKNDNASYFKWINDKQLVLNNGSYRPISEQEHEKWFNNVILHPENLIFSIIENKESKLIGTCSLRHINQVHQNAELQIRIGEYDYQNRGLGSDAVRLLIDHGFSNLNLKRIYLYVFCDNKKAIRAYEKCLFSFEGRLRKAAYINGEFVDVDLMSILNF